MPLVKLNWWKWAATGLELLQRNDQLVLQIEKKNKRTDSSWCKTSSTLKYILFNYMNKRSMAFISKWMSFIINLPSYFWHLILFLLLAFHSRCVKLGQLAMPETCENWLGLVYSCVYYARYTRKIYQVLPYSVDFKPPGELWNPPYKTVLG